LEKRLFAGFCGFIKLRYERRLRYFALGISCAFLRLSASLQKTAGQKARVQSCAFLHRHLLCKTTEYRSFAQNFFLSLVQIRTYGRKKEKKERRCNEESVG